MAIPAFKHIYGPVYSWRIGMSLGIDPLVGIAKYCNFACSYCQLGNSVEYGVDRRVFLSPVELMSEINALPEGYAIDYFTFSGNGEPTLAANLGDLIKAVKTAKSLNKVAVITNAATIARKDVQSDLCLADLVLLKLDAVDEAVFQRINGPVSGIMLNNILTGIKDFRRLYKGRLALQMMFVEGNKFQAADLARIALEIGVDEVQLNTPLRPSPVKPLSEIEMAEIRKIFLSAGLMAGIVRSVYEEEKKGYNPFDNDATKKRHGIFMENLE